MRTPSFPVSNLVKALQKRKIATMEELKKALGTQVDMTVFRKLREIEYCTSYSHRGMFYALKAVAEFDVRGLWTCREVYFSQFQTSYYRESAVFSQTSDSKVVSSFF